MINIPNIRQIDNAARQFLSLTGTHRVFAFYGEMGAGKTTFIKALCRAMEVEDSVSSPSFALIYEYFSPRYGNIYHFDLYRIREITEMAGALSNGPKRQKPSSLPERSR
jgi:tRNA threonylcarbamoyladenosine biosynthesis protein TsaE